VIHQRNAAPGVSGRVFLFLGRERDGEEEYDFSGGIRGKYAKRYAQGTSVVVIDPGAAKFFPGHDSVNQALRSLAEIIKRHKKVA
jgi:hypothetical protein